MRPSKSNVKQFLLERLLPHVFLDAPARDDDVFELIRLLRPQRSERPLRRIGGFGDGGA